MNAARITRFEAAMMSPSLSTHRTASRTTGSQSGAYSVWLETWVEFARRLLAGRERAGQPAES
jgi:hypothetical protein